MSIKQTATKAQIKRAKQRANKMFKGFTMKGKSFNILEPIANTFNR
jgi:hypothetical protein